MAGGESNGLHLLGAYDSSSDSERDSGYTSEEDKKRKYDSHQSDSQIVKNKRRRMDDSQMEDEQMIVDSPPRQQRTNYANFPSQSYDNNYTNNLSNSFPSNLPSTSKATSVIALPAELAVEGPSYIDSPTKHQGRLRCFAHDRGNWAAIFYLPLSDKSSCGEGYTSYDTLQSVVSDSVKLCRRHNISLTRSTDFHISLSKTLQLRLHTLQPLAHSVSKALAAVDRFHVWLDRFEVYVNEDKSRTFLGLRVVSGHTSVVNVVGKLNRILPNHGLPQFYKECSVHASIAWVIGDHRSSLQSLLPALEDHCREYFTQDPLLRCFTAQHVLFKAGNIINTLHLNS